MPFRAIAKMTGGAVSKDMVDGMDEAEILEKYENTDEGYVNEVLPEKMKYNLKSVKEFGFFKDIGVLFKTVAAVF